MVFDLSIIRHNKLNIIRSTILAHLNEVQGDIDVSTTSVSAWP